MSGFSSPEPIAIIGSSCRFPGGASTPSKLWDLLSSPHDVLSKLSADRFDPEGFYHPDGEHHGATNTKHSYLLSEDTRQFDAAFFSLNPREAEAMDPQHRILLETVYESMESAGVTISQLQGSQTGVYVGLMTNDYHDIHLRDMETIPKYTGTGTTRSILSNRVSYFFDWKGPSMTIDTACSSSLVAVHLAVQSLRNGETRVAVAAGANLIFGPEMYIIESKLQMLSPSGRSRMWDDRADGYGRGEGVAAVMLKPLSAAIKDGDHIECIIRETGVNQDGRTPGITMPSPRSQETLIRDTYRRAGLDLRKRSDRPQFFEAHGTGTSVGDPLEAEAICNAFFGAETAPANASSSDVLFVGGIKTVIGHLEGAAGLAGLLKASLALQNKVVPPNMHLVNLNPKVAPFTKHLRVPTTAQPWPEVPETTTRRASVNSFGFGGTNAHAIIESFDQHATVADALNKPPTMLTPLVLSAYSETSLLATMKAFVNYFKENPKTDIMDLAWTLQARRTEFSYRKAFSGSSIESVVGSMSKEVSKAEETPLGTVGTRALQRTKQQVPKILGIFTGQGAQWPTMGAELLRSSRVFSQAIDNLEDSLRKLPDAPAWSIREELMAGDDKSRVHIAEISQPLCTAVQVGLVDLLRSADVNLHAAVGHSSGEIGAAYAAGIISATDAIRIAYYRGVHAKHAAGRNGQRGAMLAAGLSFSEAQSVCAQPEYAERLSVAASNGPSTVTISGDEDAIQELKAQLEERNTFCRALRVDKAYHSHHMLPCSHHYLQSLKMCNFQIAESQSAHWISSVHGVSEATSAFSLKEVSDSYWIDNMTNPVLFSQAIERAINEHGPFDVAIEIGPHAALKGPTTQTIKAMTNSSIPYQGILDRGRNDVESFSSALGFLWENLGSQSVNLSHLTTSLLERTPVLQSNLPAYQWDHRQPYWKESRLSKNFRTPNLHIHELLGKQCTDNVEAHDLRWRNILSVAEIPWLRGHKFQNQILFPAAGHVALALEASKVLSAGRDVKLIELENISIGKAITIEEEGPGVEILFSLKTATSNQDLIKADFACYACHNEVTGNMDQCSSGRITLHLGKGSADVLPSRPTPKSGLVPVDADDFYDSMDQIGLDYTGDFRQINSITRTRFHASASTVKPAVNSDYFEAAMVHPALLDVCFQAIIAAFCFPSDGSFWTPYLPTSIKSIRINPLLCNNRKDPNVNLDAQIVEETSLQIIGDLGAYNSHGQQEIQLEGLLCSSFAKATPATDTLLFSETVWKPALVTSEDDDISSKETANKIESPVDLDAIEVNERVAYYYLRTLREKFTDTEVATFEWWFQRLFEFADHLCPIVANGNHHSIRVEWMSDTYEVIKNLIQRHPDQIDLQLVVEVGENLPTYVRGKAPLLEVMLQEDRLTRLYQEGLGVPEVNRDLSAIAKQISHQYPSMRILEIGAGTGGMTKEVLQELNGTFSSYTFTDISTGFFEKSKERLKTEGRGKMIFSALDIEKDPAAQGYKLGSYDMIIASNVLHATRNLSETMANVRGLLRPGGYLLLNEVTGEMLRLRFIMSGLPGWWLGGDDGRRLAPTINSLQWDEMLCETGFSGIDIIRQDYKDAAKHSLSVIVTQAVDEMVDFLREPLLSPYMAPNVDELFIIGGKSLQSRRLAKSIAAQLRIWTSEITFVDDIVSFKARDPSPGFTVVCLEDLDVPVLSDTTEEKLKALQFMFGKASNILYLTRDSRGDSPYSMAMVGLGRTVLFEYPELKLQFVDVATLNDANPRKIAEEVLRLLAAGTLDPSYLWTAEPEIVYENSQKLIQRFVPNTLLNNRLNSDRRVITEHISTIDRQVVLGGKYGEGRILRKEKYTSSLLDVRADQIYMDVSASVSHPVIFAGETPLYLCIGSHKHLENTLIALSPDCASGLAIPAKWVYEISGTKDAVSIPTLQHMAMRLVAHQLLESVGKGRKLLLHDPEEQLGEIILQEARIKEITVILTTADMNRRDQSLWLWLHPLITRSGLATALPSEVDVFIDFSSNVGSSTILSEPLGERIASCATNDCVTLRFGDLFENKNSLQKLTLNLDPQELLHMITRDFLAEESPVEAYCSPIVPVAGIISNATAPAQLKTLFSAINWKCDSALTIPIQPTVTKNLFSSTKTYILFGLSGEIGRSLTNFLIESGARYVVLTSRNPPAADDWLRAHCAAGATVKILANNITRKVEVKTFVDEIRKTMPLIGGVVNGAMVLQDKLFANMDLDCWNAAIQPKIDGSRHLDETFSTDTSLEFFIMFSSLASVIGNSGQSNYNAGNMYCAALALNRRKRGLAASVLDIGKIVGIGYVSRNRKAVISLRSHKFQPISEPLFQRMFAEAVISGSPNSGRQPVLSAGMQKRLGLAEEDSAPPLWLGNPRFSHMKWEKDQGASGEDVSTVTKVPVKDLLKAANSATEAEIILCLALANRLAIILLLSLDSLNWNTPLIDIGIDSLIAVEVRTWFLKELGVDMPVLKVIGGFSIVDLCKDALSGMQLELKAGLSSPALEFKTPDTQDTESLEDGASSAWNIVEKGLSSEDFAVIDESLHTPSAQSTEEYTPVSTPPTEVEDAPPSKSVSESTLSSILDAESSSVDLPRPQVPLPVVFRSGPLSHAQERMWLAHTYSETQTAYNVSFAWSMKGALNLSKLRSALRAVALRHEVLRTAFYIEETTGKPMQAVYESGHISIDTKHIRHKEEVHIEFSHFRDHTFGLETGHTMKALVLEISPTEHIFMLCYHHIIMDGISLRILLHDLNRAYHSPSALLKPTAQYLDYAIEYNNVMHNGALKDDIKYWKELFREPMDPLPLLPISRVASRTSHAGDNTYTAHIFVGKDIVSRIKESSRSLQSTSFHFYSAALQVLLFQLLEGRQEDLCFGVADANRLDDKHMETMGFFLNLLPVRFRIKGIESFAELVKRTRANIYGALAHSKVPFDVLLTELNIPHSTAHNPLFQVLLNYTLGIREQGTLAGCQMEMVEIEDASTACDLVVSIVETVGMDTAISFTMPKSLYLEEDCSRITKLFSNLLDYLSTNSGTIVNQTPLFSLSGESVRGDVGRGVSVDSWNGWEKTISHQIDHMVTKYPTHTAVKLGFTKDSLTYFELNERAKHIGHTLTEVGVSPTSRVAILSEPCLDTIASILAILRIGGNYVPLDPRNPRERLSAIMSDSFPLVLLCDGRKAESAAALGNEHNCRVLDMSSISSIGPSADQNLAVEDSPAFTLYTSGSTGAPKGIMLDHRGWLNQFASVTREYGLQQENVLQQSSPGFDMAIEQIFISLCNGGTLILAPHAIRGDSVGLTKLMLAENVSYTMCVPSEYSAMLSHGSEFLRQCNQWKNAFCGGEKVTDHLRKAVQDLLLPNLRLINVYGPTEITVSCCRAIVPLDMHNRKDNHGFCSVGAVLPNYYIYIVDSEGELVPTGFPGEVYIGGIGVGNGYLNREELSLAKFVPDTFTKNSSDPHCESRTLYRTGDRARFLNDGSLVFLGRLDGDSQIKLRGQRIELDEIGNTILRASNGNLTNVIVSSRGNEPDTFLVAFAVFGKELSWEDSERISYLRLLRQRLPLPQYMQPAAIIPLEGLPLSINGKVDRKVVDEMELPRLGASELPTEGPNRVETRLLEIWKEVLPKDAMAILKVDRDTDFFEAGGNSLLLVRLQAIIQQKLEIKIPLVEMVEASSLGVMAQRLFPIDSESATKVVKWEQEASVPEISILQNALNPRPTSASGKVVILTGATGFLGRQILQQLVSSSSISEVHCIAVRSSSSTRDLPVKSDKIFVHYGDLSLTRLGLAEATFASLSIRGDLIIHNGADVSFLKSYTSLKKSNVGSTSELIRMSAPRQIPLHFISSAGVAGFVPPEVLPLKEISVAAYPPTESGVHGYQAAKWVSERLLESASEKYGMRVVIHRPTGIIGEHASNTDIIANFLRYSRAIAAAPDMDNWSGYLDLVDVEMVASTISSLVTRDDADAQPLVTYIHECNNDSFPIQEIGKYLEMEDKRPFEILPMAEWIDRARKAGMNEMVCMYLKETSSQGAGNYPRISSAR